MVSLLKLRSEEPKVGSLFGSLLRETPTASACCHTSLAFSLSQHGEYAFSRRNLENGNSNPRIPEPIIKRSRLVVQWLRIRLK
jgi:hypothetical protein